MSSTKIINVLKGDTFEELLDSVQGAEASEIIFVLPKKSKAFGKEEHFVILARELAKDEKNAVFMCQNEEVNELARKYDFDVLTPKPTGRAAKKTKGPVATPVMADISSGQAEDDEEPSIDEEPLEEQPKDKELKTPGDFAPKAKPAQAEPVAATTASVDFDEEAAQDFDEPSDDDAEDDSDEELDDEDPEEEELEEDEEVAEEESEDEEKDYKEDILEGEVEDEPPYGTELDDEGNLVYEEDEAEAVAAPAPAQPVFQTITTAVNAIKSKRGLNDVVHPRDPRNLKVVRKGPQKVNLNMHVANTEDEIENVWGREETKGNIWSSIKRDSGINLIKDRASGITMPRIGWGSKKGWLTGLAVLAVGALGAIIYLTVGNAKIEIKPRSQELDMQFSLSVSPNHSTVNSESGQIPGQLFNLTREASGEFSPTAERDAAQKARGAITIYNEFSASPQPLVATTRFEYVEEGTGKGLVFRTLNTVTVPGMSGSTPGQVTVEIVADQAGQQYNVPAGTFRIVAWKEQGDNEKYQKMYAKSSENMKGGILGKSKVVSEEDYNNAKDLLAARAISEITDMLKNQASGLIILDTVEPTIKSVESNAEIDDAADTLQMTVQAALATVGFRESDLVKVVSDRVERSNGLKVVPEKLKLEYSNPTVNAENGTMTVTVKATGNVYARIDNDAIAGELSGKKEADVRAYLGALEDVDSARVIFSPFWVKKVPKDPKKIQVLTVY